MKGSTFNQLRIFEAIVSEGSIRGAARRLAMAAPSVSLALQQLEKQLDLPLFQRSTRKIELTEAGLLLSQRIDGLMNELDLAFESVQDLSAQPSGIVSLNLPHFAFECLIKPIYAEFCERYPDIELELYIDDAKVDILETGHDIGIRFGHMLAPNMVAYPLSKELKDALFVSPAYAEKHGIPTTPDELQKHKLIRYRFIGSNKLINLRLNNNGQEIQLAMPTALVANNTDVMVDAALQGLGVGRMALPLVEAKFASGELIPVMEEYWLNIPALHIYFLQNSQKAKRVRVLVDFLKEKYFEQTA
ncbi:MAG: LysR family transcriptional regulator [Cellvibrionaceae bacterium]|nr:LysR family transcriptional regulator [Cellvibrionaceae bacterium]